MKKIISFIVIFLLFYPLKLILAQNQKEVGRPFMTTFHEKEHGGYVQTWAFVQDPRGVIYAGNQPGILEFDGSSWRMIGTANNSFVRSLDIDRDGRIYVGANADFGYLAPNPVGEMQFVSLIDLVPEQDRNFNYVWTTHVTNLGIYFQTRESIFRLTPDGNSWKVKIWKPKGSFNFAFWLNGTYYVQQGEVGLMKMVGDSLQLLPNGEQFANDRLQVMLPLDEGNILVGTFNRGIYSFDGHTFRAFNTEADQFLRNSTLYDATILTDGTLGFSTISGGFIQINKKGIVVQYLNQGNGLTSNSVLSSFVDRTGTLWLGPESGIQIIETPSPMSRYGGDTGLDGAVYSIIRYKGVLYCGTSTGIFSLDTKLSLFKKVPGLLPGNTQTFGLIQFRDMLLAAVGTGLYSSEGNRLVNIKQSVGLTFSPNVLKISIQNGNRLFIGGLDGFHTMLFEPNSRKWVYEGQIGAIHEYIQSIAEVEPGVVWLGVPGGQEVIRITCDEPSIENSRIDRFGVEHGLTSHGGVKVDEARGEVIFISNSGVFRFDKTKETFYMDSVLYAVSIGNIPTDYNGVSEDKDGNLWISYGKETAVLRKNADNSFGIDKLAFQRFSDVPITDIYPDEGGAVWFGFNEGVIRYDPSIKKNYEADFSTLVRRVTIGEDSVIYGGAAIPNDSRERSRPFPTFDYASNAMRFEFAAPTYDNPKEIQYQSMLEGFDERWSIWSKENKRDYTNLPFGEYRFHVQARNIYQHLGSETIFEFRILPPWYRTWWAYISYILLLGALIFAADRVQRRRLIKKERDRAQLREAELRAKEAEASSKASQAEAKVLQAENERKKNIELLSEIGKEITASLSLEGVIDIVYEHVNTLMDASAFGIGVYNKGKDRIDMPATKEKGETLPLYYYELKDENRPAVWCFRNQKEIFINDYEKEYTKYIKSLPSAAAGDNPESMMYLPVTYQNKRIGVITAQSFKKNAFSDFHLNVLRNLATYAAIALDNADAYRKLNSTVEQLNKTLDDLKATQQQLITQEKLASLGALTAGIAHEIKNPLNFVNNFAELSVELVEELREDLEKQKDKLNASDLENLEEILNSLEQNAKKINEHGKRADSIVHSMLQHSRGKAGERQETDINAMLEEDLNLAYHGMRARDSSFNVTMETNFDKDVGKLTIVPQDVSRVFLNILTNCFYEVHRKKRESGDKFSPQVSVRSNKKGNMIEVRIRDNGDGIPESIRDKLFNPFFTTKPAGQGTGLGLSLSYDIIAKEHHGDITFESKEGEYTEFIITLPSNGK